MDSLPHLEQWHRKISREVLRGRQHQQSAIDALRLSSYLIGIVRRMRNRIEEQAMTPLTDAQLDRVRQTVAATIEEWRMSYRVEPDKTHRDLENMLVAACVAMHQSGAITINQVPGGAEGGVCLQEKPS